MKKSKVISGTQVWSNDNDGLVQSIDWRYTLEIDIPDVLLVPNTYVNATVKYSSPWAGNVYRNPNVSYFADSWGLSPDINVHLDTDPRLQWDNPSTDTWSLAESNIASAFALQSPPVSNWQSHCLFYCIDKDHFSYGSDITRTVRVYVDANGYLSNVPLLGEFKRYVNPDTNFTTIGVDTYTGVISVQSEFDWSYFPFAIRKGSSWESCNRDGGNVRKFVRGGFANTNESNRKNSLFDSASDPWPTVFTRHGSWVMSPKIGNNG